MAQTAVANSTIAGVLSYPAIAAALAAILAIAGITIPQFTIGALVITQAMDISVASAILSYVVNHYTSDSVQQQIASLAALAPKLLAVIPRTYSAPSDFPNAPKAAAVATDINKAAAAIAVIEAHAETQVQALPDTGFPTGKNGQSSTQPPSVG